MNVSLDMQIMWTGVLVALTSLVFALPLLPAVLASRGIRGLGAMFIDGDDDGSAAYAVSIRSREVVDGAGSTHGVGLSGSAVTSPEGSLAEGRHSVSLGPNADVSQALMASNVYVKQGTHLRNVVTATRLLYLEEGCRFSWLDAPSICFGYGDARVVSLHARLLALKLFSPFSGDRFQRFEGDQTLEAGSVITGDRLGTGDLNIGEGCTLVGSLKVYGNVKVGAGSSIKGSIFSEKSAVLGARSFVSGVVSANDLIELGCESVVGTTEQLSSVSASRIRAAPGAVVHGSIRAREAGYFPHSGPKP